MNAIHLISKEDRVPVRFARLADAGAHTVCGEAVDLFAAELLGGGRPERGGVG